jgi:hypothetical protein
MNKMSKQKTSFGQSDIADWNDLDFMISHGGKISKIAIVVEPRWEALALAFAGAGGPSRASEVFLAYELEQARSWLAE